MNEPDSTGCFAARYQDRSGSSENRVVQAELASWPRQAVGTPYDGMPARTAAVPDNQRTANASCSVNCRLRIDHVSGAWPDYCRCNPSCGRARPERAAK